MGAKQDFENPNLFTENPPGEYTYTTTEYGKSARGQLQTTDSPQRDSNAQRTAGGEERRGRDDPYGVDDGGHLIGARFAGAPGKENLTAQDRNLNRGAYKSMENEWADRIDKEDKVFVQVDGFNANGGERPTNYMGHVITETVGPHGEKTRELEYISFNNESRQEQEEWEKTENAFYEKNPEVIEEQMSQNTLTPSIWDDERGELVDNPYYVAEPSVTTEETDNPYAADSTPTVSEEDAAADYSVGGEASVGPDADNGADNDQGMD